MKVEPLLKLYWARRNFDRVDSLWHVGLESPAQGNDLWDSKEEVSPPSLPRHIRGQRKLPGKADVPERA